MEIAILDSLKPSRFSIERLESLSLERLQEICSNRGLETKGTKQDLINRILETQ